MRITKRLAATFLLSSLLLGGLAGCREESVGEKIERKVRNAGDDIEDALDD